MGEPPGLEFLSAAWFAALAEALGGIDLVDGPSIVLGQIVTDVPSAESGEVRYTISLGGGRPARVTSGSLDSADVVLVAGYAEAFAMATGEATGASLLAAGRVKVRGDVGRLIEAAALLEAAGAAARHLHGIVTRRG